MSFIITLAIVIIIIILLVTIAYFIFVLLPIIVPKYVIIGESPLVRVQITNIIYPVIFVIINVILYKFIFIDMFFNNIYNIKAKIDDLDIYIMNTIKEYGSSFDAGFYKLLTEYNKDFNKINKYIYDDIINNNINNAKQKIFIFVLYSYLYDVIPAKNEKAINLINYYFFNDPTNISNTINFNKELDLENNKNEFPDLTFYSLLPNNKNLLIKKYYNKLNFHKDNSLINNKTEIIEDIINSIDKNIDDLNNIKTKITDDIYSGVYILGFYLILCLIINSIYIFIYSYLIYINVDGIYNDSIKKIIGIILNIILNFIPRLQKFFITK